MPNPNIDLSDYSLISISEASKILGISCKTARNWLSSKRFPIHTVRLGGRRMMRSMDLISYVTGLQDIDQSQSHSQISEKKENKYLVTKKKGRPRKT